MTLLVPVRTQNPHFDVDDIRYRAQRYSGSQARLCNRFVLSPEVDFSLYKCSAVIDWINIDFSIKTRTQFKYLRPYFDAAGTSVFVEPLENTGGTSARKFRVKIQQPRISSIRTAFVDIDQHYRLQRPPVITEIEISIDFYSKNNSDNERLQMVRLLAQHLHVADEKFISSKSDRPRFVRGVDVKPSTEPPEKKKPNTLTDWLLKSSNDPGMNRDKLPLQTERDQAPYADATFYIGKNGGPIMWRVMHKTIDRQNRDKGTHKELDSAERRARIEVTLKASELRKLNIKTLDELVSCGMMKFKHYFSFKLPTFVEADMPSPIRTPSHWLSRERWHKFRSTGVFGLHWMDAARYKRDLAVKRKGIEAGYPLRPHQRRGGGTSSMLVSYNSLNKRVETALRHLTESMQR